MSSAARAVLTLVALSSLACADPRPAAHAGADVPAARSAARTSGCGAHVAPEELAAIRNAGAFDGVDLASALRGTLELDAALASDLPGSSSSVSPTGRTSGDGLEGPRAAYAQERDALKREVHDRLEALTRVGTMLRDPVMRAERAAWDLSATCEKKKRNWCEAAAQLTGGASWDDERSVTALARGLDVLTERGRPVEQARAAASAAKDVQRALVELRATREAALKPLAHRPPALEVGNAWIERCTRRGGIASDASMTITPPPLVVDPSPNVRKLTVIVEARLPRELSAQFQFAARSATTRELSALYAGIATGRSGSGGMVVLDRGGDRVKYVVTNRHVVEHADAVSVVLEDGTRLPKANVVYVDPAYDLAIVEVPVDAPIADRGGFAIETRMAKDGEPIVATGFPGLLGTPSFQTTRGYVSNERLLMKDDAGAGALVHVQHTAAIDGGSSGGPLTSADGKLLGVNAFKLTSRDGVALAVPASAVSAALRDVARARGPRADERAMCLALASELALASPRVEAVRRLVGSSVVSAIGIESHNLLLDEEPGLFDRFQRAPITTLSEAVARRIVREAKLARGTHPFETCALQSGQTTLAFADGTTRRVRFTREQGHVVLAEIELPRTAPAAPPPPAKPSARPRRK